MCAVFGPDKLNERKWIGSLAWRVDCFNEIPVLKKFTGEIYALLYNVTVPWRRWHWVPSIFKHNDDVPEKKQRKSKATEKLASKMVNSK